MNREGVSCCSKKKRCLETMGVGLEVNRGGLH